MLWPKFNSFRTIFQQLGPLLLKKGRVQQSMFIKSSRKNSSFENWILNICL